MNNTQSDVRRSIDDTVLAHRLWLESIFTDGVQATFDGQDLSNVDLIGVDLRYANFRGTGLRGANLTAADLSHADLRGATLHTATLDGARLDYADLTGADVRLADLKRCSIIGVKSNDFLVRLRSRVWAPPRVSTSEKIDIRKSNEYFRQTTLRLLGVFFLFLIIYTANAFLSGNVGLDRLKQLPDPVSLPDSINPWSSFVYVLFFVAIVGIAFYRYILVGVYRFESSEMEVHQEEASRTAALGQRYRKQAEAIEEKLKRSDIDKEQRSTLMADLRDAKTKIDAFLKEAIEKDALDLQITQAIKALKSSLQSSDDQRASLASSASFFRLLGVSAFALAILGLLYTGFTLHTGNNSDSNLLWRAVASEKWGGAVVLFTFPISILLLVGTALLRHENKLLQEVRVYTEYRLHLDTMGGLLNAARFVEIGDGRRVLIRDTFLKIRDALIVTSPGKAVKQATARETKADKSDSDQDINAALRELIQKRGI